MIKKRVAMLLLLVVSLPFCIFADETNPDGEISNITIPERSSRKVEPKAGKTTLFVAGDSIDRAGRLRITPEPADTSALAMDSIQQSVMNASLVPKPLIYLSNWLPVMRLNPNGISVLKPKRSAT